MAPSQDPLAPLRVESPGPVYLLHGKEQFLVDRGVEILRNRVLDPRTRDFNYEMLHGKEATSARILSAARTLPMMAKRRLVLIRDIDEMKADELAGLSAYVAKPAIETCLVMTAEKVDARLKFFAALKKAPAAVMLKLDALYERQLPAFIQEEARERGVRFEPGAAQLLCDEIGADLGQLADAVERLASYVGDKKVIGVADIEEVVATTRQRSVFELCNAVGEGSRERAFLMLGSLVAARESGVRVVAMLARHIRQLATARELVQQRMSRIDLAQALGIPPFFVEGIEKQARRLDGDGHAAARMHDALFRADRDLKSSRLDDARILERLVLELTE